MQRCTFLIKLKFIGHRRRCMSTFLRSICKHKARRGNQSIVFIVDGMKGFTYSFSCLSRTKEHLFTSTCTVGHCHLSIEKIIHFKSYIICRGYYFFQIYYFITFSNERVSISFIRYYLKKKQLFSHVLFILLCMLT